MYFKFKQIFSFSLNTILFRYIYIEMLNLNSTFNFGIPPVLVFQLEVYYKVDRLLTGRTAQPKGTTARWYSNKKSLEYLIQGVSL